MIELAVIFGGSLTVLLIIGWLLMTVLGKQRRLRARVEKIGERARPMTSSERRARQLKRKMETSSPLLEGIATKLLPRPDAIRNRLQRTGHNLSLGRYFVLSFAVAIIGATVPAVVMGMPWFFNAAVAVSLGIGVPHFVVGVLIARRMNKFTIQFPDAIDLMVRGLRSGLPVTETISACGREMSEPVGSEFRRIADAIRLGQTLEDALWDAARRLDTPEFKFFVISLSVQKETGGNLAETLANLSDILRSRKQMKLKIKAMSSEAKASAMILGSLPFLMFGIIYFLSPEYESALFTDMRGRVMLGAALTLMTGGILVMRKMVRFEI
ncbi:MAG: type II secretion system F family protein [Rhodospirillales bacterium]|nr:type II secretion system F family protein [Rhodospirillales bacterium]MBO6788745.1 type II secretion system F family protein [Rhodospirillales bacterium]